MQIDFLDKLISSSLNPDFQISYQIYSNENQLVKTNNGLDLPLNVRANTSEVNSIFERYDSWNHPTYCKMQFLDPGVIGHEPAPVRPKTLSELWNYI